MKKALRRIEVDRRTRNLLTPKEFQGRGTTLTLNPAQEYDSATKDFLHKVNEVEEHAKGRLWEIEVIFGWRGEDSDIKQVGMFRRKPPAIPREESARIIDLHPEARLERTAELKYQAGDVDAVKVFRIEDMLIGDAVPNIYRDQLVDMVYQWWAATPIQTNGKVRVQYGHFFGHVTRDMLLGPNPKTKIARHVRIVLDLMTKGFRWDPHLQAFRRMGIEGTWSWVKKR